MNVYKLKTTDWESKVIDKKQFENDTAKRPPYYLRNNSGEESLFAVCPACNNPIQIIGLYPKGLQRKAPFGRHVPHDVKDIANYSREAYEYCPYSNPHRHDPNAKKKSASVISDTILKILQKQFDRVIYLISKETGIVISDKLAEDMLKNYMGAEGFLYAGATLMNIPWILAYRSGSFPLFGRIIREGAELEQHLLESGEHIVINNYGQLMPQKGYFLDISFCFVDHESKLVDMQLEESMDFLVTQMIEGKLKEIFRKKIIFNHAYFQSLTQLPEDHPQRKIHLVKMAEEILG